MQRRRLLVAVVLVAATLASILWDRWAAPSSTPTVPGSDLSSERADPPQPEFDETASRSEADVHGAQDGGTDLTQLIPDPDERAEVLKTLDLVRSGGPYPHRRDGIVFRNRERLLPVRGERYYREYTVRTPERRDRGPRRLVIGRSGEVYYTRDHYSSFVRIDMALADTSRLSSGSRNRRPPDAV